MARAPVDKWTVLAAAVAGSAAVALSAPVAAGIGVGAAVIGVKVALERLLDRRPRTDGERVLPVRHGSPEARWLQRADRAHDTYEQLTRSLREGPVRDKVVAVGERVETTLAAVRRLAGQTSAVAGALGRIDGRALTAERERLARQLRETDSDDVKAETERSLASVRTQLDVQDRLVDVARTLMARLESGTIGVEALVARLAEVLALSETASSPENLHRIEELADELEGLRSGLAETEDLSRRALSAYEES